MAQFVAKRRTLPRLEILLHAPGNQGSFRRCRTGDARLSSVRGLNRSLQWGNERNPRCQLQVSGETAPSRGRKVRMTPSQRVPLISWAAHALQSPLQEAQYRKVEQISKSGASSDWSLQPDSMKPESLVIVGQLYHGEYVLELCTHRRQVRGVGSARKTSSDVPRQTQ